MKLGLQSPVLALVLGSLLACSGTIALEIAQPTGPIPVLHEVDVVVIGGTSGGVAAAVEASNQGAKVFLAAPRPYLGEDMCGTYRLWLEAGETPTTPLATEVYNAPRRPEEPKRGLPFKYTSSAPSSPKHPDNGSMLTDKKWQSATNQSVQYDADTALNLDLGLARLIARVTVAAYQRPGDFEVSQVVVSASDDAKTWKRLTILTNDRPGQAYEGKALLLTGSLDTTARHLRLEISRAAGCGRILLGEVIVEGPDDEVRESQVAQPALFTTPMQVKRTLDQALIKANVPFLFWCYGTELLRDSQGRPAGVVISTRSGRQAVIAKVIIDATERANIARLAGAAFSDYPSGLHKCRRVVVGGSPRTGAGTVLRQPTSGELSIVDRKGDVFPVHDYELEIEMKGGTFADFARAEQTARDLTWTPDAADSSEVLFQVPPDKMNGRSQHEGAWPGAENVPLGCFVPKESDQIIVLGGCADISRQSAEALLRPVNQFALGARLGREAARRAGELGTPQGVRVAGKPLASSGGVRVREVSLDFNHRAGEKRLEEPSHALPVLGEYDVVVVGGGTGGSPAGIGAGRQGARTLVIEYLHGLGGVGTMGFISSYYHGNRVGFSTEVDRGVEAFGDKNRSGSWHPEHKGEWYRRELKKAGAQVWCGVLGQAVVVEGNRVIGVVVLTPQGRGVVLAKTVIDSTGNADIAAAAGARCRYTDGTDVAVQGTGLPQRELGQKYTNTDYTFVDDTDVFDIWRVLVTAKMKFRGAYDLGQLIDTRERRQIVGDFTFSPMDMMLRRTFPDTIVIARSNFDTHGYIIHPMFMIRPPDRADIDVRVPWRCLLPAGLEGIIVTGLGVSAHRDALPCIRMQADIQNQGYAAGVAAAMIVKQGITTRALDIRQLQEHLVSIGNLPASVLTEVDNFPLPAERVAEAVRRLPNDYQDLEIVLSHWGIALPLLQRACAEAGPKERLSYAHVLGMMGDATGAAILAEAVKSARWDEGWRYTGMGQFGPSMSPLDSLIVALGRTKSSASLGALKEKIDQLDSNSEFSHFRAITLAAEALGDPSMAEPLARLLRKPGLQGHATTSIEDALKVNPTSGTDTTVRNKALTELYLSRALYRCGDYERLGEKTLQEYSRDLHGHYARHAQAILKAARGPIE